MVVIRKNIWANSDFEPALERDKKRSVSSAAISRLPGPSADRSRDALEYIPVQDKLPPA